MVGWLVGVLAGCARPSCESEKSGILSRFIARDVRRLACVLNKLRDTHYGDIVRRVTTYRTKVLVLSTWKGTLLVCMFVCLYIYVSKIYLG